MELQSIFVTDVWMETVQQEALFSSGVTQDTLLLDMEYLNVLHMTNGVCLFLHVKVNVGSIWFKTYKITYISFKLNIFLCFLLRSQFYHWGQNWGHNF